MSNTMSNNIITLQRGKKMTHPKFTEPSSEKISQQKINFIILKMVNRWQKERDDLDMLLGDRSPYWGQLPFGEEEEEEEDYEEMEYELDIEEEEYNNDWY